MGGDAAQLHWLAGGIGELGADDLERAGRGRGGRGRRRLFDRSLLRSGVGRSLRLRLQRVLGPRRRLFHHQGIRSSGRGQAAHRRGQGHADAREHHEHRHRDADAREPCPSRRLSHGTLTSRASQPAHFQGLEAHSFFVRLAIVHRRGRQRDFHTHSQSLGHIRQKIRGDVGATPLSRRHFQEGGAEGEEFLLGQGLTAAAGVDGGGIEDGGQALGGGSAMVGAPSAADESATPSKIGPRPEK